MCWVQLTIFDVGCLDMNTFLFSDLFKDSLILSLWAMLNT